MRPSYTTLYVFAGEQKMHRTSSLGKSLGRLGSMLPLRLSGNTEHAESDDDDAAFAAKPPLSRVSSAQKVGSAFSTPSLTACTSQLAGGWRNTFRLCQATALSYTMMLCWLLMC